VKKYRNTYAQRLNRIPPYLFADLDRLKTDYQNKNKEEIIDFGEGNPMFMPPKEIVNAFTKALGKRENHRYPSYAGKLSARIAVANWYKNRFGVKLDPETEVAMLLGSKEGVAHLIWGIVDKDDVVYVPSPSYPIYLNQTLLAGGNPKILPLIKENRFLPNLSQIKPNRKLKLLCLNYPNNPTSAVAPFSFYQDVVAKAHKLGFSCFNDNVYSELYYTDPPHSILEVPGAKDCCVEFHSLSKTFSMCGWRIGFVVGNKNIINALLKIKQNVDSGPFGAIQDATIFAYNNINKLVPHTRNSYKKRLLSLSQGLNRLGWQCQMPDATFYLWTKIPISKYQKNSIEFSKILLTSTGVLVAPGRGFGESGEGYIRLAAILPLDKIEQALERLSGFNK
jgi:LL-diaminopimelate aminotransferase